MALKQNQTKPGHLKSTSTNPTPRTGRPDGFDEIQGGVPGHKHGTSTNPTDNGGSVPEQGPVKGYKNRVSDRGIKPVRKDLVENDGRIG